MPIIRMKKNPAKKSSSKNAPDKRIRKIAADIQEFYELRETANAAGNAVNRKKTVIKNSLHEYLADKKASMNDSLVVDGLAVAFRPNVSEEIDPRVWYEWWTTKRISDNQFFSALSVSVATARDAVGNDQIGQLKHETLSKTNDLRISPAPDNSEGDIVPFAGASVKPAKIARQKETDNSGKPIGVVANKKVRRIRL